MSSHIHHDLDIIAFGKVVDQPTQCCRKSEILKDGGTEISGKATDIFNDLVHILNPILTFSLELGLVGQQVLLDKIQSEFHDQQGLT